MQFDEFSNKKLAACSKITWFCKWTTFPLHQGDARLRKDVLSDCGRAESSTK